jgi:hypothetical protein
VPHDAALFALGFGDGSLGSGEFAAGSIEFLAATEATFDVIEGGTQGSGLIIDGLQLDDLSYLAHVSKANPSS